MLSSRHYQPKDAEHAKHWEFKMDTYFDQSRIVTRLYREWKAHPRLIIAVDFDDTIYDFHQSGQEHKKVIQIIKECQALGFYIVLFTARAPDNVKFAVDWCSSLDIRIDSVNKNPIELPYGNNGKMYYNILLDDRAGLHTAYLALASLLVMIRQEEMLRIEREHQKSLEQQRKKEDGDRLISEMGCIKLLDVGMSNNITPSEQGSGSVTFLSFPSKGNDCYVEPPSEGNWDFPSSKQLSLL